MNHGKYKFIKTGEVYELLSKEDSPNGYYCMWKDEKSWFNLDITEVTVAKKFEKVN